MSSGVMRSSFENYKYIEKATQLCKTLIKLLSTNNKRA